MAATAKGREASFGAHGTLFVHIVPLSSHSSPCPHALRPHALVPYTPMPNAPMLDASHLFVAPNSNMYVPMKSSSDLNRKDLGVF